MAYVSVVPPLSGALPAGRTVRDLIRRLPTPVPRPMVPPPAMPSMPPPRPGDAMYPLLKKRPPPPQAYQQAIRAAIPAEMAVRLERLRPGKPPPPGMVEHIQRLPARMFRAGMYRRIQGLRPGRPLPVDLAGWDDEDLSGFFKKIFKPIKKVLRPIYRPIVAAVKPFLRPLVAMIPIVGPAAAVVVGAAQTIRASAKAQQAQQTVAAQVQQAPSWGTMTPAQQQAVIGAIMAGQIPNIQVPPDVSAAYQQAIQQQAAALPPPPGPAPAFPEYAPGAAAAAPAEAGMGTGAMLGIGAAAVVGMMLLGGGRR